MVSMLGALAEYERSLIGARVKESLNARKARGAVYNHPPIGFRAVAGRLEKNPAESALIDRVQSLKNSGMKPTAIARQLMWEVFKNRNGKSKFQCIQVQRYLNNTV